MANMQFDDDGFVLFDPFASFMTEHPPEWRNKDGRQLQLRRETAGTDALFGLACAAADEWMIADAAEVERWHAALAACLETLQDARERLPFDRVTKAVPSGARERVFADGEHFDDFTVVTLLEAYVMSPQHLAAAEADVSVWRLKFHELWCYVCFREIEEALGREVTKDSADSGMAAAMRAVEALANARAQSTESNSQKHMAQRGATARHAENRAIKREVMGWLDEKRDPQTVNGDETAGDIAGKVAPISWRTARDYVTEWKKLRSAGRP